MPSAITSSPYLALLEKEDDAKYLWSSSDGTSSSRTLTNVERMFEAFNHDLHGQNCPFMAGSLTLRTSSAAGHTFGSAELEKRTIDAFIQTRFAYPTVAARVVDRERAVYDFEDKAAVAEWAKRTVKVVRADGGWMALREKLSKETKIPSADGDYCLMYIIIPPSPDKILSTFDVMIHTDHTLTDGPGLRSILNEFLERLAAPLPDSDIIWGKEIPKLLPASLILEKEDELPNTTEEPQKSRFKGLARTDIGLPVYRPDIHVPTAEIRGTQLVSHTFPPEFLPALLNAGRARGVKLAAVLHASLLKAIYDSAEAKPTANDIYSSGSAMDLRNGYMYPEFCEPKRYVSPAVAIQPMDVPCSVFMDEMNKFWGAAAYIRDAWAGILKKRGIAREVEKDAKGFLANWASMKSAPKGANVKPRTCPYFVSDPPGSLLLSSSHKVQGLGEGLEIVLEHYQVATDQNNAVVSARSHSWNNKLTLCLVFNATRNPQEKMQEFMKSWVAVIEGVCEGKFN